VTHVSISGDPTDEEVAAIVAAVDAPTPRGAAPVAGASVPRWRWSGRWWSKPVPARRNRPW